MRLSAQVRVVSSDYLSTLGIRMALGAQAGAVVRMVLTDALRLAGMGIAIGVSASVLAVRALQGLLYNVGVYDPLTFSVTPLALLLVAAAAGLIPSRRAALIGPLISIRSG